MVTDDEHGWLRGIAANRGFIIALTGAGISAESGIPTFRGAEGYWTVGSAVYQPTEMATSSMFERHPEWVWAWYLYRRSVCRQAHPNAGHAALVKLDQFFGHRFLLVTQNVDGLHLRAKSPRERTYEIHGNIDFMRCSQHCNRSLYRVPEHLQPWPKDRQIDREVWNALTCPQCHSLTRPHVLWFDEHYDEQNYRFESCLEAAERADLLITIGTSGATNLPNHMVNTVTARGGAIVDINPEMNPFGRLARKHERGHSMRGSASDCLPKLVSALTGL